ncbi:MAG: COX15/CtaA family protein [Verrucomicrobiae bacterium]|nr:COX15/CtaA family protein [Verrucomicrobiae bacterium]
MAPESTTRPWLSHYAALTALATVGLIALGGLVTSHGVGMAVPDWPTTYGYNMFLFPVSQWVGGIFYEHTHRLYASVVGLMTVILAVGLQLGSKDRRLIRLGWMALALVVVQGVLGGLRVNLMKDQIGVVHAALAQLFLALLVIIAVLASPAWRRWKVSAPAVAPGVRTWVGLATGLILVQLLVGAGMRHQHAGLAVPDFPLAYGRVWPPMDEGFLQRVNAGRMDTRDFHPITPFHVQLHMAHRVLALGVTAAVLVAALRLRRAFGVRSGMGRVGTVWVGLVGVQILLGAITVWSNKAADMATAHVVVGALCLVAGVAAGVFVVGAARVPRAAEAPGELSGATAPWVGVKS